LLIQEVDGQNEIEVGYHIFPGYWGQGYVTEAAAGFIEFAFNHAQANSIISIIDIENIASIRVAEKNGMRLVAQTTWVNDELVGVYRIDCSILKP
jgi:RimJ/RimL family protein N-acetyltransferase